MNEQLATTANLLHPRQVVELNDTRARLQGMLGAAPHIRGQLADSGAMVQGQLAEVDRMLRQAPEPIPKDEIDAAVRLETELRGKWLDGMPTQAEMRKNPPGAVDKNKAWSNRTKDDVLRWKHLRRRLHASGISEHRLADEGDISNIEMFRPAGGSGEMSMDNAQIPGRQYHLPPPGAGPAAVMSEDDAALLQAINPEVAARMATYTNEQREKILAVVRGFSDLSRPESEAEKPKKPEKPRTTKRKDTYAGSELAQLRAAAKALGINSYQKGKAQLREEIAARQREG
jgi:hypothetical protein